MSTGEPGDVARLRAALASLRDDDLPVDAGRIFDAAHGKLSVDERQAVVDELLANPAAAEAWRLALELAPETPAAEAAPPREWSKRLAIAAAIVLAVGAGWRYFSTPLEPVYRGSETRTIASSLPADALLPRTQPVLRWMGVEGGRYRVRVLTPELELLEESEESPALEHTMSAPTLARVPPGGRIFWQVEARVPEGGAIVSPTFSARIE